jgi:hypothetical protein
VIIITSASSLFLAYFTITSLLNLTSALTATPVSIALGGLEVDLNFLTFNLLPYLLVFVAVSKLILSLLPMLLSSGFSNAFFYDR